MTSESYFQLTEQQLAAAMELCGLHGRADSRLPKLVAPGQPLSILKGHPCITANATALKPAMAEALRLASAPGRVLAISSVNLGTRERMECRIHDAGNSGPFSVSWESRDIFHISLASDTAAAAAVARDWIGLSNAAIARDLPPLEFSISSCAALFAAADAWRAVKLRARVAGRSERKPVLNAQLLERVIQSGNGSTPVHGLVTDVQQTCSMNLRAAAGQMQNALFSLQREGLIEPISRGWGSTPSGEFLIGALSDVEQTVNLSLEDGTGRRMGKLVLLSGETFLWTLSWPGVSTESTAATWTCEDRTQFEQRLIALLRSPVGDTERTA